MGYSPRRGVPRHDQGMNIVDRTRAAVSAADTDRFRLRRFIEELPADELDVRSEPIDLAGIAAVLEGNAHAVLFRSAGPERAELAANVTGSRTRIARAFGVAPPALTGEIQRR